MFISNYTNFIWHALHTAVKVSHGDLFQVQGTLDLILWLHFDCISGLKVRIWWFERCTLLKNLTPGVKQELTKYKIKCNFHIEHHDKTKILGLKRLQIAILEYSPAVSNKELMKYKPDMHQIKLESSLIVCRKLQQQQLP